MQSAAASDAIVWRAISPAASRLSLTSSAVLIISITWHLLVGALSAAGLISGMLPYDLLSLCCCHSLCRLVHLARYVLSPPYSSAAWRREGRRCGRCRVSRICAADGRHALPWTAAGQPARARPGLRHNILRAAGIRNVQNLKQANSSGYRQCCLFMPLRLSGALSALCFPSLRTPLTSLPLYTGVHCMHKTLRARCYRRCAHFSSPQLRRANASVSSLCAPLWRPLLA